MSNDNADLHVEGHAGQQAVAALMAFGTDTMFTLNGGHIWPLYDAARDQGMKVVDTRHEQTATFAAEAYAKLTQAGLRRAHRRPGHHQRCVGNHQRVLQRLAVGGAGRSRSSGSLG